jgi:dUTP pyrophosphatase
MRLRIKKTHVYAVIPKQMTEGAAGFDLTAVRVQEVPNNKVICSIGLAFEIPVGYVGLLFPRSSVVRTDLRLANAVGVIDSDYRGEVSVVFDEISHGTKVSSYGAGDRVAQMVIIPIAQVELEEVDELSSTDRGSGGFGSTDKEKN